MFNEPPACAKCGREIASGEQVYLHMRYPKHKGFTEIKAYLKNEATFICEKCYGREN